MVYDITVYNGIVWILYIYMEYPVIFGMKYGFYADYKQLINGNGNGV